MPQVQSVNPCEHETHWANLKRSDVEILFRYIPLIEAEFQKGEKAMGRPMSACAASQYYDFTDLKWALYKDMAFLGLVTEGEFDQANLGRYVSELEQEKFPDPVTCLRLLATTVQGNNYSNGFFEYLIKLKYVLQILQGLERSFQPKSKK